jgi:hypothetical protein
MITGNNVELVLAVLKHCPTTGNSTNITILDSRTRMDHSNYRMRSNTIF